MGSELKHDHGTLQESHDGPQAPPPISAGPSAPFPVALMTVGHAQDAAEFAADRIADVALQRLPPMDGAVGGAVLRTPSGGAGPVGWAGGPLDGGTSATIAGLRGSGRPLPSGVRDRMETAFGADFGRVRVHDDGRAAELNRAVSAAAFTTGQDIFFGSGRFAPDTADGERMLAHELAHTLQRDQYDVRRRFVRHPGGPGAEVIPWPQVNDLVTADGAVAAELGDLTRRGVEDLDYPIRKLADGPDIVYQSPKDVLAAAIEMRKQSPGYFEIETGAVERRLVRITTLMRRRVAELAGSKTDYVRQLAGEVEKLLTMLDKPETAQTEMLRLIASARKEWAVDNRHVWLAFNLLSQFGPLSHQLSGPDPDKNLLNGRIGKALRELRMVMASKENVGVVAHRGAGPTNRTMGKLIADDDNRRVHRPAENSPAAFTSALAHTSTTKENLGLDGVECDVYLSKDGVPIVTHEANLKEQLRKARQAAFRGPAHVYEQNAADITAMQRTDVAESTFITLGQLLTIIQPAARAYYEVTGRAFRFEIEMKGSSTAFGGKGGKYEDKISGDAKAGLGGPSGHHLRVAVAREISRLRKQLIDLPIDFVLFNGEESDAHDFATVRRTKVALGDITVAMGTKPENPLPALGAHGQDVDELRFMLYAAVKNRAWLAGINGKFILTGVFGQEFAPAELKLASIEPSRDLTPHPVRKPKDAPEDWKPPPPDTEIAGALRLRRSNQKVQDEQQLDSVLQKIKSAEIDVAHFRLLTDYAAKAAFLKGVVAAAIPVRAPVMTVPEPKVDAKTTATPEGATPKKIPGPTFRGPTAVTPVVGASVKKDASPPTSPTGRPVIGGTPKAEVKSVSPGRPVIGGTPKKVAEPPPTGAGSKRKRKKKSTPTTDPSTDD